MDHEDDESDRLNEIYDRMQASFLHDFEMFDRHFATGQVCKNVRYASVHFMAVLRVCYSNHIYVKQARESLERDRCFNVFGPSKTLIQITFNLGMRWDAYVSIDFLMTDLSQIFQKRISEVQL